MCQYSIESLQEQILKKRSNSAFMFQRVCTVCCCFSILIKLSTQYKISIRTGAGRRQYCAMSYQHYSELIHSFEIVFLSMCYLLHRNLKCCLWFQKKFTSCKNNLTMCVSVYDVLFIQLIKL